MMPTATSSKDDVFEEKKSKEFAELVEPVIEWLNKNYHPHATIIINCISAEVLEGAMCFTTEKIKE